MRNTLKYSPWLTQSFSCNSKCFRDQFLLNPLGKFVLTHLCISNSPSSARIKLGKCPRAWRGREASLRKGAQPKLSHISKDWWRGPRVVCSPASVILWGRGDVPVCEDMKTTPGIRIHLPIHLFIHLFHKYLWTPTICRLHSKPWWYSLKTTSWIPVSWSTKKSLSLLCAPSPTGSPQTTPHSPEGFMPIHAPILGSICHQLKLFHCRFTSLTCLYTYPLILLFLSSYLKRVLLFHNLNSSW